MKVKLVALLSTCMLAAAAGIAAAAAPQTQPSGTSAAGPVDGVRFVVSWVQDADPAKAGATAYEQGLKEMGTPPKAIMFFERFGVEEGKTAVKALRAKAGDVPTIGTKSVPLVNGGVLQQNVMAILMIGGPKANVKISKTALDSDRSKTGIGMAAALKDVPDLKVVMALSEGDLSFEQGVNVEGFLHGVFDTLGTNVSLWGGNGSRVQYYNDEVLSRYVVALGLGGPISVVYSTATEFQPVGEPVTVTKVSDVDPKLVLEFDGRPAPEVYRERRGMPAGGGAVLGAVVGGSPAVGAVIGGAAGAFTGYIIGEHHK